MTILTTLKRAMTAIVAILALVAILNSTHATAQTKEGNPNVIQKLPIIPLGTIYTYQGYRTFEDAKNGDNPRWTQDRKMVKVLENGNLLFEIDGGPAHMLFDPYGNILERSRRDRVIKYKPSSSIFRYPMRIGDKFKILYSFDMNNPKPDMHTTHRDATVEVIGWETATVPAGTFMALRIEVSGNYKMSYHKNWQLIIPV